VRSSTIIGRWRAGFSGSGALAGTQIGWTCQRRCRVLSSQSESLRPETWTALRRL